MRREKNSKKK